MNKKQIGLIVAACMWIGAIAPTGAFAAEEERTQEQVILDLEGEAVEERKEEPKELQGESIRMEETESTLGEDTQLGEGSTEEVVMEELNTEQPEALDYVLGRPLTEEEKAAERKLEPELLDLPEEDYDIPEISDEIDALGISTKDQENEKLYEVLKNDQGIGSYGTAGIDAVYDPRTLGLVTPIRSQSGNTCWAFSSLAAGEQSLISKGAVLKDGPVSPQTLDLSEGQMAYYFYHPVTDPLGNTFGDGNYNISPQSYLEVGSSTIFSTFALANWVGAAKEEDLPLDELYKNDTFDDSLAFGKNIAHLQNAYWINFKDIDAVNSVKQMIRQYGAAAINLYYSANYFNSDTKAYYYPLNPGRGNNHSVTLVGWDDNYKKENFQASARPSSDGAWIVKNSYGPEWGDSGYFYLSYEDSAVNTNNTNVNRARAFIFDFEPSDNYVNNYQYDGTAGAYNCSFTSDEMTKVASGASVANVFTVPKGSEDKVENLRAISFALYDTAVNYSVQIYKNPINESDPMSGEPMLTEPKTGTTSYVGYYTVELGQDVLLKGGDKFAVVLTFTKESGNDINFFVDATYSNGGWVSFVNTVKKGQSFKLSKDRWEDLSAEGMTARIKAFTDEDVRLVQELSLQEMEGLSKEADGSYKLTAWTDKVYQLVPKISPLNASRQNINWSSTDTSVITVDQEGRLVPLKSGNAIIKGTTTDGTNISVLCNVTVKVRVSSLKLNHDKLVLKPGESQQLKAIFLPESATDTAVTFTSSEDSVATVGTDGNVTGITAGKTVITAKVSDGSNLTAACQVIVTEKEQDTVEGEKAPETGTEGDMGGTVTDQGSTSLEGTIDATGQVNSKVKGAHTQDSSLVGGLLIACFLSFIYLWKKRR